MKVPELGRALAIVLLIAGVATLAAPAQGQQGPIGKRDFAVTRTVEDPLVTDELFLSIFHIKRPGVGSEPPARETDIEGELLKTLTPNLGLFLDSALIHLDPDGGPTITGFDNLEVGLKYAFFTNSTHEAIVSAGLGWEVGGTGRKAAGADSFDTIRPALFWGKGFGDLPDALNGLRPLALTGLIGFEIPSRGTTRTTQVRGGQTVVVDERNPNALQWGFVVEYSLPYLQSTAKMERLGTPFKQLIPVVELGLETFLDRGSAGKTNGTVNPGIIWQGDAVQFGVEAVIPINDRTGKNVGVQASLTFFFDELFPGTVGRPLFGR